MNPTRPGRIRASILAAVIVAATLPLAACGPERPDKLMDKARAAIAQGEPRTAEIHLKNLLQQRPDDVEARLLLAGVHSSRRDARSAEKEWQRALELGAAPDRALPGLLEARVTIGDAKGALDAAGRHAVSSAEARAATAYWSGRAQAALGRPQDAEQAFRSALAAQPDFHPAQVSLIALQAGRGDLDGASAAIDTLLARAPALADALLLKAELQIARRDPDGARATLEKAVESDPAGTQALVRLVSLLIDRGDLEGAQARHAQLAKLAPGQPMTTYLRALLDFRLERFDAARDGVLEVLKVAPGFVPAIALGANVALRQGALEQADAYARQVTERAPGSLQGARLTAAVAMRRGDPDRALQAARAWLERGSDDAMLLGLAGEAALRRNDVATATAYFERATKLDPKDAGKRTGLGLAKLSAGRTEAGFADLEAAVEADLGATQADLALIAARMRARQYPQALEAIDRLEKKQPGTALPHNLRGTALLARGDAAAARTSFEQAARIDPRFFAATANLAELDVRDKRPEDARKRLEDFLRQDPKSVQASMALAQLVGRTGGPRDEVERILKQAQSQNPAATEPVLGLARLYVQAGRPRDAIPVLQQSLARQPDDRQLLDALGTAFLRADEKEQAVGTFEKLVRLDARNPSMHLRMGELKASLGDSTGALASFRLAAELDPRAPAPQIAIAGQLLREGRKEEARRIAIALQKQSPASPAGLVLEGDLLAADGKWLDAVVAYRKAAAIERSAPLVIKQHRALLRADRRADADVLLRDGLRAAPDDLPLRMYAGETAIAAGQWKAAVDHYEVALRIGPGNAVALNNLAWSLKELGDPRALSVAEDAYRRAPESAPIADTLGTILVSGGDVRRGLELLKKATVLSPKAAQYRLHYAQALAAGGDRSAARAELERLLAQTPSGPSADTARALIAKL